MPLRLRTRGEFGAVYYFVRPSNGRAPSEDFLKQCEKGDEKKFKGSFNAFIVKGAEYENQVRFKALHDYGKPLWEFKEHSPRIYTVRELFALGEEGGAKRIIAVTVLLDGWKKNKDGKAKEEKTRIEAAMTLFGEYLTESDGQKEPMGTATERAYRSRR